MPVTATAWNMPDEGYGWEVTRGPDGLRGQQHFLVNTHDEGEAVYAAGLPATGSPWGTGPLAGLLARYYTSRYIGGRADRGGVCVVTVQYAQESQYSGPEPAPLKKWLAIMPADAQVTLYQDVRWTAGSPAFEEKLLNGDGFARDVGIATFVVHRFVPLSALTLGYIDALRRLNELRAVNTDPVTFPPLLGGSVVYTYPADTCRFLGFTIPEQPARDDLYHVSIALHVADDHLLRWTKTDEFGRPYQSFESQVYERRAFGALW